MYWRQDRFFSADPQDQAADPVQLQVPETIRAAWEDLDLNLWKQRIRDSAPWKSLSEDRFTNKSRLLGQCCGIARRRLPFYRGSCFLFELQVPTSRRDMYSRGLAFFAARLDEASGGFETIVPLDWQAASLHGLNAEKMGEERALDLGDDPSLIDAYCEFFCDFVAGNSDDARSGLVRSPFMVLPADTRAKDAMRRQQTLTEILSAQRATVTVSECETRLDLRPAPRTADPKDGDIHSAGEVASPRDASAASASAPAPASSSAPVAAPAVTAPLEEAGIPSPATIKTPALSFRVAYQSVEFQAEFRVERRPADKNHGMVTMLEDRPLSTDRFDMPVVLDLANSGWPVLAMPRPRMELKLDELQAALDDRSAEPFFQNRRISGDLDFSRMRLPDRAIRFHDVEFLGHLRLDDTCFAATLDIVDCVIVGQLSARNASIGGSFHLARTRVHGMDAPERDSVDARHLHVGGVLDATALAVQGPVSFVGASVRGNLVLDGLCLRDRPDDPNLRRSGRPANLDLSFVRCEADLHIEPARDPARPVSSAGSFSGYDRPWIEPARKGQGSGHLAGRHIQVCGRISLMGLRATSLSFEQGQAAALLLRPFGTVWRTLLDDFASFDALRADQLRIEGMAATNVVLQNTHIGLQGLWLQGAQFRQNGSEPPALHFALAVSGLLAMGESRIDGMVLVDNARLGALSLGGVAVKGQTVISAVAIQGGAGQSTDIDFGGGHFASDLDVHGLHCCGIVRMVTGRVGRLRVLDTHLSRREDDTRHAPDLLLLTNVTIEATAGFRGLTIENAGMSMIDCHVGDSLEFWRDDGYASAEAPTRIGGTLNLCRNVVGAHLRLTAIHVNGALNLSHTRITNDLQFHALARGDKYREKFQRARVGMLDLSDAVIDGDAYFAGLDLHGAPSEDAGTDGGPAAGDLRARRLQVKGLMELRWHAPGNGASSLHQVRIPGQLDCSFASIRHALIDGSSFQELSERNVLVFDSAEVNQLEFHQPLPRSLQLSGCQVGTWKMQEEYDIAVLLTRMRTFDRQTYLNVERSLRNEGNDLLADHIYVAMRNRGLSNDLRRLPPIERWSQLFQPMARWQPDGRLWPPLNNVWPAVALLILVFLWFPRANSGPATLGAHALSLMVALGVLVLAALGQGILARGLQRRADRIEARMQAADAQDRPPMADVLTVGTLRWLERLIRAPFVSGLQWLLRVSTGYFTSSTRVLVVWALLHGVAWVVAADIDNYDCVDSTGTSINADAAQASCKHRFKEISGLGAGLVALRYTVPIIDVLDDEQLAGNASYYAFRANGSTEYPASLALGTSTGSIPAAPAVLMRGISALAWLCWPLIVISWAATARSRRGAA